MNLTDELAEKVMGWHKDRICESLYWLDQGDVPKYLAEERGFDKPWSPQENIADAWMIVDKIREMPYKVKEEFQGYFIYNQIDDVIDIGPGSICTAALKAVNSLQGK
jgi:hypothetical protein